MSEKPKQSRGQAVRDKFVDIAAELFYRNGVHAIGVDEVVRQAGMAKASLYRWFPSKDDLVLAVLQRRDENFWAAWDATAAQHADPLGELHAQLAWMQGLATREGYRGCAFVNAAAEFDSPQPGGVRERCLEHEEELRHRLRSLAARLHIDNSERLADCLHIAIVGTFALGGLYPVNGPAAQLGALVNGPHPCRPVSEQEPVLPSLSERPSAQRVTTRPHPSGRFPPIGSEGSKRVCCTIG